MMKVAHLAIVTPGACGLYETTRELVAGLRELGVDSCIVDPLQSTNKKHPGGMEDRGARFAEMSWALEADVIVSHSGIGEALEATEQPLIHVAHGRPRSSFLNKTNVYSHMFIQNRADRCKAVISFWPEHEPYLQVMFPDTPIHIIQAPVDLEAWTPKGLRNYRFHGHADRINLVCVDMWRDDVDPFAALNAYALWAREVPGAKLHLYGLEEQQKRSALLKTIQCDKTMGTVQGFVKEGLPNIYRAATATITSQTIDTRSVREAMACGCPVIRIPGPNLNGFRAQFWEGITRSRKAVRQEAEQRFDPKKTAIQFYQLLQSVLIADGVNRG